MKEYVMLDVAIYYVCYRLFFVVSTLKECKAFDFSVFVGTSLPLHLKDGNWTTGRI